MGYWGTSEYWTHEEGWDDVADFINWSEGDGPRDTCSGPDEKQYSPQERYENAMDIDPVTGAMMRGRNQMQLSVMLQPSSMLYNLDPSRDTFVPLLEVHRLGCIPPELSKEIGDMFEFARRGPDMLRAIGAGL